MRARKPAVRYPEPNIHSWRAVCGTSPQYSPSPFPHTLPKPSSPWFAPLPRSHAPYLVPQGGGGKQGRGRYVPSRHQGVRRGARTGSLQEQGTYRLDRPTKPNHHIQPKIKTPHHSVRGSGRAADGNRTRVSGLGSVRSTIELQPHLFQCIAPACRG